MNPELSLKYYEFGVLLVNRIEITEMAAIIRNISRSNIWQNIRD